MASPDTGCPAAVGVVMSNYFWSMHETLKQVMMFRRGKWLAAFLWMVLPATIFTYIGWVLADLCSPNE